MKINEVPQDNVPQYYEGIKRACYALDDQGKYVIVPSCGWSTEDVVNGLAVAELATNLEKTRREVLKGLKSPLVYHMERRQMTPAILAKTVGMLSIRVRHHFRPDVFQKLKPEIIQRYAQALKLSLDELKSVPGK